MNAALPDWLPYSLPLVRPWESSRGTVFQRTGHLARLRLADGRTGWGDAAPWPAFAIDQTPARAFAAETARLDLAAQDAGLPLGAYLSGGAAVATLAVNVALGALATATPADAAQADAAGFSVIKLKVGIRPPDEEIALLRRLCAACPRIRWRLDANRAWEAEDAAAFVRGCAGLPVEGLEEPLRHPDHAALAQLQANAAFAIAIDESAELLDDAFFTRPPVRRIVLKPARNGGWTACREIAARAVAADIGIVVSSALESACGRLACAHLAAAVAPGEVHGLATGGWLAADTGQAPAVAGGRLFLPQAAGLGFRPAAAFAEAA